MTISTTTHLNFRGNAREALEFYQSVFGGEVTAFSYTQANAVQRPEEADQVIWGQVASDAGFRVMAYDVPASLAWDAGVIPVFVSVRGDDEAEITGYWQKLIAGGSVVQDLGPAGWSSLYGMVRDRFGVTWVLDVMGQQ